MIRTSILFALIFSAATPASAAVQLQSLLLSGSQAPGAPNGVNFTVFDSVSINSSGHVSFWGSLSNGLEGIWSNSMGQIEAVAIEGNPAPGTPVRNYSVFLPGGMGDNGQSSFTASLTAGQHGAFSGAPGSVQNIARLNGAAPGLSPGSFFTTISSPQGFSGVFSSPAISPSGSIAFYSTAVDADTLDSRFGIWSNRGGALAPIVLTGHDAPDYPPGATITGIADPHTSFEPRINGLANVAFSASISGPGINPDERAVYVESQGSFHAVARTSAQVPGSDLTTRFQKYADPSLNNQGNVAFSATLTGPTVTPSNDVGIWSTAGGSLHMVAREGDAAPGTAAGVVFSSITPVSQISGDDRVLVHGKLSGPGIDATRDSGLWMEQSGILEMVFQAGMQAPGLAPGLFLTTPYNPAIGYAMNSLGYLVFRSRFGSIDGSVIGDAIFTADPDGNLDVVAWTGQSVEVLPGIFKTINSLTVFDIGESTGGEDGARILNNAGKLISPVGYTDGTKGILIATIPEPATAGFAVICATLLKRRMRR